MLELNFTNEDELIEVCHALSTDIRINILKLIKDESLNVVEIANKLNIPASTAASNINVLEKAGLIITELHPAKRGAMKVCTKNFDAIHINLNYCDYNTLDPRNYYEMEMPIGHFINCKVYPTCGMADEKGFLVEDDPDSFFIPSRVNTQILWFRRGFIEYRFPKRRLEKKEIQNDSIEFSMEICSEAPGYNNQWPSDITFYVNDIEIATWTSPGDFGGVKGKLNPAWWSDVLTQYGLLKHLKINRYGSYIDEELMSNVTIEDLKLDAFDYINFKIALKDDAVNKGGVNLFGKQFGNYPQDILMKMNYLDLSKEPL